MGWRYDCYLGASTKAIISLVEAFGYTPMFSNNVNLIFDQLDQSVEMGMIIPSVETFPGPMAMSLHIDCPGKKWNLIEPDIIQTKATDPNISHSDFAASFQNVVLTTKKYGN